MQEQFRPRLNKAFTQRMIQQYYRNPMAFNPRLVRALGMHAEHYQIPFRTATQEEAEFSPVRAAKNLVQGFAQGFTTLKVGEQPINEYEQIARAVGSVMGFTGTIPFVGPKTPVLGALAGKSIPLRISKMAMNAISPPVAKAVTGLAGKEGMGFLQKAAEKVLDMPTVQDMAQKVTSIGIASATGQIWDGPLAMIQAAAGGARHTAGRHLITNLIATGHPGADVALRSLTGGVWTALPGHVRSSSTPQQVYDFLLGSFFSYRDLPTTEKFAKQAVPKIAKELQGKKLASVEDSDIFKGLHRTIKEATRREFNRLVGTTEERSAMMEEFAKQLEERYGIKAENLDEALGTLNAEIKVIQDKIQKETQLETQEAEDLVNNAIGSNKGIAETIKVTDAILKNNNDMKLEKAKQAIEESTLEAPMKDLAYEMIERQIIANNILVRNQIQQGRIARELSEKNILDKSLGIRERISLVNHAVDISKEPVLDNTKIIDINSVGENDNVLIIADKKLADMKEKINVQTFINEYMSKFIPIDKKPSVLVLDDVYDKTSGYYKSFDEAARKLGYREMADNTGVYLYVKDYEASQVETILRDSLGALLIHYQEPTPNRSTVPKQALAQLQNAFRKTSADTGLGASYMKARSVVARLYEAAQPENGKAKTWKDMENFISRYKLQDQETILRSLWVELSAKKDMNRHMYVPDFYAEMVDGKPQNYVYDRSLDTRRPVGYNDVERLYYTKYSKNPNLNAVEEISHVYLNGRAYEVFSSLPIGEVEGEISLARQEFVTKKAQQENPMYVFGGRSDHQVLRFHAEHPNLVKELAMTQEAAPKEQLEVAFAKMARSMGLKRGDISSDYLLWLKELGMENTDENRETYMKTYMSSMLWLLDRMEINPEFREESFRQLFEDGGDIVYTAKAMTKRLQILDSQAIVFSEDDIVPAAEKAIQMYFEKETLAGLEEGARATAERLSRGDIKSIAIVNDLVKNVGDIDITKDSPFSYEAFMDGDVIAHPLLIDTQNLLSGLNLEGGVNKSFQVSHRFAGKNMSFKASVQDQRFMQTFGIDQMFGHGAVKMAGNRAFVKLSDIKAYADGKLTEDEMRAIIDNAVFKGEDSVQLKDYRFVTSTFYDRHNIDDKQVLVSQLLHTLGSSLYDRPELRKVADDMMTSIFDKSYLGDKETSQKVSFLLDDNVSYPELKRQIPKNIDNLSVETIIRLWNHPDPRVRNDLIMRILNVESPVELLETGEISESELTELSIAKEEVAKFLETGREYPINIHNPNFSGYATKALSAYFVNRLTTPKVDNSMTLAIATPSASMGEELIDRLWRDSDGKIRHDWFYLGSQVRTKKVDIIDNNGEEKTFTMGELWDKYSNGDFKDNVEFNKYIEGIFSNFVGTRVPQDSVEGAQVMTMKGFFQADSATVFVHPLRKEYHGGADDDGDKLHIYMSTQRKDGERWLGKGLRQEWAEIWKDPEIRDARVIQDGDAQRLRMPKSDSNLLDDGTRVNDILFEGKAETKGLSPRLSVSPGQMLRFARATIETRGSLGSAANWKKNISSFLDGLVTKGSITGRVSVGHQFVPYEITLKEGAKNDVNRILQSLIAFGSDPADAERAIDINNAKLQSFLRAVNVTVKIGKDSRELDPQDQEDRKIAEFVMFESTRDVTDLTRKLYSKDFSGNRQWTAHEIEDSINRYIASFGGIKDTSSSPYSKVAPYLREVMGNITLGLTNVVPRESGESIGDAYVRIKDVIYPEIQKIFDEGYKDKAKAPEAFQDSFLEASEHSRDVSIGKVLTSLFGSIYHKDVQGERKIESKYHPLRPDRDKDIYHVNTAANKAFPNKTSIFNRTSDNLSGHTKEALTLLSQLSSDDRMNNYTNDQKNAIYQKLSSILVGQIENKRDMLLFSGVRDIINFEKKTFKFTALDTDKLQRVVDAFRGGIEKMVFQDIADVASFQMLADSYMSIYKELELLLDKHPEQKDQIYYAMNKLPEFFFRLAEKAVDLKSDLYGGAKEEIEPNSGLPLDVARALQDLKRTVYEDKQDAVNSMFNKWTKQGEASDEAFDLLLHNKAKVLDEFLVGSIKLEGETSLTSFPYRIPGVDLRIAKDHTERMQKIWNKAAYTYDPETITMAQTSEILDGKRPEELSHQELREVYVRDKRLQGLERELQMRKSEVSELEAVREVVRNVERTGGTKEDAKEARELVVRYFDNLDAKGIIGADKKPALDIANIVLGMQRGFTRKSLALMTLEDWKVIDRWFETYNKPTFWMKLSGKTTKDDIYKLSAWDWWKSSDQVSREHMRNTIIPMVELDRYIDANGNWQDGSIYKPTQTGQILQDIMGAVASGIVEKDERARKAFQDIVGPYVDTEEGKTLYAIDSYMRDIRYHSLSKSPTKERVMTEIYEQQIKPELKKLGIKARIESKDNIPGSEHIVFEGHEDKFLKVQLKVGDDEYKIVDMRYDEVFSNISKQKTAMGEYAKPIISGNEKTIARYRLSPQELEKLIYEKTGISGVRVGVEGMHPDKFYQDAKNRMISAQDLAVDVGIDGINLISATDNLIYSLKKTLEIKDVRTRGEAQRKLINIFNREAKESATKEIIGDNYVPHIDVDLVRMKPIYKKALEEHAKNYNNLVAKAETLKPKDPTIPASPQYLGLLEEIAKTRSQIFKLTSVLKGHRYNEEIDGLSVDFNETIGEVLREQLHKGEIGDRSYAVVSTYAKTLRHAGNTLQRTSEGITFYNAGPEAYIKYLKRLVNTSSKNIGYFMAKHHIRDIEDKRQYGEYTHQWANYYKMYVTESLGLPNVVTPDLMNDPKMKIKGTIYGNFTDTVMQDRIFELKKTLGLVDNPYGLDEQFLKPTQEDIIKMSHMEARYQLMTLLAHTRTTAVNMFGGAALTTISVGHKYWLKAHDQKHIMKNLHPSLTSREKVMEFVRLHGVIEDHLIYETGVLAKDHKANFEQFARAAINKIKKDPMYSDASLYELAKQYKISDAVFEKAAGFMRFAERQNRTDSFVAHYLHAKDILGGVDNHAMKDGKFFGDPILVKMAKQGVKNTQFLYSNIYRPPIARTSFGKMLTRFQLWTWNHLKFRTLIYEQAKIYGYREGTPEMERHQRMAAMDMISFALSQVFVFSIFDATLPPPLRWLNDFADWMMGDTRERERAFFGAYPGALAPLQLVTPAVMRWFPNVITGLVYGDWKDFTNYTAWTMFPFGRLARDATRSAKKPDAFIDRMSGIPVTELGKLVRPQENWFVR